MSLDYSFTFDKNFLSILSFLLNFNICFFTIEQSCKMKRSVDLRMVASSNKYICRNHGKRRTLLKQLMSILKILFLAL